MTSTAAHLSTTRRTTRRTRRRRVGTFGLALVALAGGSLAFAAWLSNGTGTSQDVVAGSAAALTVNPVTPAVTGLVPGTSRVSNFTVSNANTYQVTLSSATVSSITVTGGTGCTAGNADVTTTVNASAVGTVVAGGGSSVASANFTVTVAMGAASDNGCQGATFTPNLSVAGASS